MELGTERVNRLNVEHWYLLLDCEDNAVNKGGVLSGMYNRDVHAPLLTDLEKCGIIRNANTIRFPIVELTDLGWAIAGRLRRCLAEGDSLKEFDVLPYLPQAKNGEGWGDWTVDSTRPTPSKPQKTS